MDRCTRHVSEAFEIARKLTILADEGESAATDDSCFVLYGVIRDCAYKIRSVAERRHRLELGGLSEGKPENIPDA